MEWCERGVRGALFYCLSLSMYLQMNNDAEAMHTNSQVRVS